MRIGKRAVVIPAHSGQRGRIVARSLFRGGLLRKESRKQRVGGQQSAGTHCHPIQKIPPRNRAVHAELSIALLVTHGRASFLHLKAYSRARKLLHLQTDESNIRPPQITRRIGCKSPLYVAYAGSGFPCSRVSPCSPFRFRAVCKHKPTHRSSKTPATSRTSSSTTTKRNAATPKNSSLYLRRIIIPC